MSLCNPLGHITRLCVSGCITTRDVQRISLPSWTFRAKQALERSHGPNEVNVVVLGSIPDVNNIMPVILVA
jgi:hypothetical protein